MLLRTEQNDRNDGIDLLRIAAMYMIVIVHLLNKGGVLDYEVSKAANVIDTFIAATVYSCVNCYALISGFVGYREGKYAHRFSGLITMWFQVVLYGLVIITILKITGVSEVGLRSYIKAVIPISTSQYWYFTAYVGLMLIAPYLHMLIDKMDKNKIISMCVGIILLFSFYCRPITFIGGDPFVLKAGYSFVWLAALYLIGAVIKKYLIYQRLSINVLILTCVTCVFLTGISRIGISLITNKIWGRPLGKNLLLSYISPTILLLSISLLILFSRIKMNKTTRSLVRFATPATFGVYLIHVQPLFFADIIGKRFKWIAKLPIIMPPITVLVISAAILIVCLLIDKLRINLFEYLRIKTFSEKVEKLVIKIITIVEERVYDIIN